jgi:nucleotide-binding universal stress UspA family protein
MPNVTEQSDRPFVLVVALDLADTESGGYALDQAMRIGTRVSGSQLHVLHVSTDDVKRETLGLLRLYVSEKASALSGPRAQTIAVHVKKGDPAHEIAQLATDLSADLIVVGTHKMPHLKNLFVGSTAERVMASATCPVVVAGPRPHPHPSHAVVIEPACPVRLARVHGARRPGGGRGCRTARRARKGPRVRWGPRGRAARRASLDGGITGSIPVSCLSPCHGFNGVVAQFQTSVHYTEYLVNVSSRRRRRSGRPPARLRQLPRDRRLQQRSPGNVGTTNDGGVVVNLASGELQYRDPATARRPAPTTLGSATVAEVYCTTCHAVTNANDPHKTGIPWTPGSFPLVSLGGRRRDQHRAQPVDGAVTGHPGERTERRQLRSRQHVHVVPPVARRHHQLPDGHGQRDHERLLGTARGAAGRPLHGRRRLRVRGQTYGEATHEQKLSCVDCHMVPSRQQQRPRPLVQSAALGVPRLPRDGATSFDVNGFESEIQAQ